ncbi:MAG TPA: LysM peptidoglycan-binding domain-containing protein [Gammaproteobacteria bacterium]|nr:LysM peptidoglycan-binding domain-containing protein [Gammaproteobacteria bacterium]
MARLALILAFVSLSACNTLLPRTTQEDPARVQPETAVSGTRSVADADHPAVLWPAMRAERESQADHQPTEPPPPEDLWERIRAGFALADVDHPRIRTQFDWYARHPAYMARVAERARPYLYHIVDMMEEHGLPTEIALLPIVESAFQPFAYSHGRAAGIWQFIPATGRRYGLKQNWWYDGRRDVLASTRAAIELLDNLHREFHGDWLLALAAYNSGSGTVRRAVRNNRRRGRPTDFWHLKLPPETRAYVPKLLALKKLIASPEAYGIELPAIPNEPYLAEVHLDGQIDLARAAELADIPLDELYRLNPGFNRWATDPEGPHILLIPRSKIDNFHAGLQKLPPGQRISWIRYRIRPGDTLSTIAVRHNVSIATLKRVNHLRGTRLRAGHSLMIPVASRSPRDYRLSADQRTRRLQNTPRKGTKVVYIVRPGDTFWDLSRKHGVSVRSLAKWNGMAPRDPLKPGQKLVIWSRRGNAKVVYQTVDYTPPPSRRITKRIGYRVRKGDSLARISRKFRVSISQLRRWNNLPKGKYLQPGQRLTVYVDVTAQSS